VQIKPYDHGHGENGPREGGANVGSRPRVFAVFRKKKAGKGE
jgi:hypothetical protein